MKVAVLHAFGKAPGCEQFAEPEAGEGEVIVSVHAASLKPIDKQLASGSHYASPREFPVVCGSDGVGHLNDGQRVFSSVEFENRTVRWLSVRFAARIHLSGA